MLTEKNNVEFDLDAIYGQDGTIDFTLGLSAEEKKDAARMEGITYGKIKAGDFAAKGKLSGASVDTATPGKRVEYEEDEEKGDAGTLAKSIVSFDVDTTVAGGTVGRKEDVDSFTSGSSLESIGVKERCSARAEVGEDEGSGDEEPEDMMMPPVIRRKGVAGGSESDATNNGDSSTTAVEDTRNWTRKEEEEENRNAAMFEWCKHLMRNLGEDEACDEDIKDRMDLIVEEMENTNFVNSMPFDTAVNEFEGLMDDEMIKFVVFQGEDDHLKVLDFVRRMRNETLVRMEEMESDDDLEDQDNTGGDCELKSKTQQVTPRADENEDSASVGAESRRDTP